MCFWNSLCLHQFGFGNIQPCKPKIKYKVSLQVQNWDIILTLGLERTKNVAICAFSLGKFVDVRRYACVKDLTNIMSTKILN